MNGEIHHQVLRLVVRVDEFKRDGAGLANAGVRRRDGKLADAHIGAPPESQGVQRARLALLDRPPQGMANDPVAFGCCTRLPTTRHIHQNLRMVFADVIEVVGHRAANIQRRVVLQQFKQIQNRLRVGLESRQAHGPRQARARTFRYQPAHVLIGVVGPLAQLGQGGFRVVNQKRAN